MTEQDTYEALKRATYEEVRSKFIRQPIGHVYEMFPYKGWDYDRFENEYIRRDRLQHPG